MNSMIYKKKSPLLLFLVPAFLFLIVYLYYPFFQNIINTVMKIGGLGRAAEGLNEPWYENYKRLFTDPYMRVALKNTMLLIVCTIVFQVGIALILGCWWTRSGWVRSSSVRVLLSHRHLRHGAGPYVQPDLPLQRRHGEPAAAEPGETAL